MQQQLLIIDDYQPIHALVKALLVNEPLDIHSATDSRYGLTLAQTIRPDLVLLDVDMPNGNGFETCKKLKSDPTTAAVPVIFLTASSTVAEKVCGLKLGAVDYVTKPFNQSELLARVRGALATSYLIHLLEDKALVDPLTGLGNRAMFDQRMAAEVALRARFNNPLACMVLDIDHFKAINDTYGHVFGDQTLRKIAGVISDMCRTEDVACRYGGEEFVVIAPHTNASDAAILAERMRMAISEIRFPQQGESIRITCSIGVAEALTTFDRSMLQRADKAMYRSKREGRNQVSLAPPVLEGEATAA